jgi:hypothetical protein
MRGRSTAWCASGAIGFTASELPFITEYLPSPLIDTGPAGVFVTQFGDSMEPICLFCLELASQNNES